MLKLWLHLILSEILMIHTIPIEKEKENKPVDLNEVLYSGCVLPENLDFNGLGGIGKSFIDCGDAELDLFEKPPPAILALKGSYPMVCCPRLPGNSTTQVKTDSDLEKEKEVLPKCKDFEEYDDPEIDCEYDYSDLLVAPFEEFFHNDANSCREGTTCTLGSKCGLKDFDKPAPPTSCGFDLTTGQDKFCCTDLDSNSQNVKEPQPPLFPEENGNARPCMDQSMHCARWAKIDPDSCSPDYKSDGYSQNSYPFMREVCPETCRLNVDNFRGNKCEMGCVDEYERCPEWSRLGHCTNNTQFMYLNCRESCGSCGFKSTNNMENQVVEGKQYTDMTSSDYTCGERKKKEDLDETVKAYFRDNVVIESEDFAKCRSVVISDKHAISSARCWKSHVENSFSKKSHTLIISIRDGTKYEEDIGVK